MLNSYIGPPAAGRQMPVGDSGLESLRRWLAGSLTRYKGGYYLWSYDPRPQTGDTMQSAWFPGVAVIFRLFSGFSTSFSVPKARGFRGLCKNHMIFLFCVNAGDFNHRWTRMNTDLEGRNKLKPGLHTRRRVGFEGEDGCGGEMKRRTLSIEHAIAIFQRIP